MFINDNAGSGVLLQQLKQGNEKAYNALFEKYWRLVYNAAYKRLPEQASEITEDVFLQLWLKREHILIQDIADHLLCSVRDKVYEIMYAKRIYIPIAKLMFKLKHDGDNAYINILRNNITNVFSNPQDA